MVNYTKYGNQSYSALKDKAKTSGQLFVDDLFKAETSSLFFSRSSPPFPVEWKRPKVPTNFIIMMFFRFSPIKIGKEPRSIFLALIVNYFCWFWLSHNLTSICCCVEMVCLRIGIGELRRGLRGYLF